MAMWVPILKGKLDMWKQLMEQLKTELDVEEFKTVDNQMTKEGENRLL
jgi:hypothetical protein